MGRRGQEMQRGKIFLYISTNKLQSLRVLTTSIIQGDRSCILRDCMTYSKVILKWRSQFQTLPFHPNA